MSNEERLGLDKLLNDVPVGPAPLETLLFEGRAARRRRRGMIFGGAALAAVLVGGGGMVAAQALDGSGTGARTVDPATQSTAPPQLLSPYETLRQTQRERIPDRDLRAKTALQANQELGFDSDSGFRYLIYTGSSDDWCVTDGTAVVSFNYWGDGAALLYTDAPPRPTPDDCATVDFDDPIPAEVKVAFRTDPDTHQYRLEKGGDLISQAMIDDVEGR